MSRFYLVSLKGSGVAIKSFDRRDVNITGFYTTRRVLAGSIETAKLVAKDKVTSDWRREDYVSMNTGGQPNLEIEMVRPLSLYEVLFRHYPVIGYTFYGDE